MRKPKRNESFSLYGPDGRRKYLTGLERARFLEAARTHPREDIGLLCTTLALTGCRLSEVLALTSHSINADDGSLAIRSLTGR